MKSSLLFVNARQTYFAQSEIERFLALLDCRLSGSEAAFGSFLPALSSLLSRSDVVFVVAPAEGFPPAKPACAAALFDQYRQYREKPYCQVASVMLLFGAGLLGWFVFGG